MQTNIQNGILRKFDAEITVVLAHCPYSALQRAPTPHASADMSLISL
jgi:hypothetical protein